MFIKHIKSAEVWNERAGIDIHQCSSCSIKNLDDTLILFTLDEVEDIAHQAHIDHDELYLMNDFGVTIDRIANWKRSA